PDPGLFSFTIRTLDVSAIKLLEYSQNILFTNSWTTVTNLEDYLIIFGHSTDSYGAFIGRVFDRVFNQITQHAPQRRMICAHRRKLTWQLECQPLMARLRAVSQPADAAN